MMAISKGADVESEVQAKVRVREQPRRCGGQDCRKFHRARKPILAHVANNQGIEVAVQSGVDALA